MCNIPRRRFGGFALRRLCHATVFCIDWCWFAFWSAWLRPCSAAAVSRLLKRWHLFHKQTCRRFRDSIALRLCHLCILVLYVVRYLHASKLSTIELFTRFRCARQWVRLRTDLSDPTLPRQLHNPTELVCCNNTAYALPLFVKRAGHFRRYSP